MARNFDSFSYRSSPFYLLLFSFLFSSLTVNFTARLLYFRLIYKFSLFLIFNKCFIHESTWLSLYFTAFTDYIFDTVCPVLLSQTFSMNWLTRLIKSSERFVLDLNYCRYGLYYWSYSNLFFWVNFWNKSKLLFIVSLIFSGIINRFTKLVWMFH